MTIRRRTLEGGRLMVGALLLAAVPRPGAAQESYPLAGARVALYNLAGRVDVVRGTGPEVVVRVTRGGPDAGQLEVETGEIGGRQTLRVIYPGERVVYSERSGRFQTQVRVRSDGTFGEGGERVSVRSSGSGIEAWADLRVEVPDGRGLEVNLAAGETSASGVSGDLVLDAGTGAVTVSGHRGALDVDTGSGRIDVRDVEGEVRVDTGSGSVDITNVRGPRIRVDTGSGSVDGSLITTDVLGVDTGSGRITLRQVTAPDVSVDTGSGSIEIDLTVDVETLDVDSGSGSVTLRVPADLGAELEVETGSGGIDVDFPVELRVMRRNELLARIGDGRGRIRIDTGSGEVRLIR